MPNSKVLNLVCFCMSGLWKLFMYLSHPVWKVPFSKKVQEVDEDGGWSKLELKQTYLATAWAATAIQFSVAEFFLLYKDMKGNIKGASL